MTVHCRYKGMEWPLHFRKKNPKIIHTSNIIHYVYVYEITIIDKSGHKFEKEQGGVEASPFTQACICL